MKKIILIFIITGFVSTSWAQDENLKYSSQNKTGEVNFSPFSSSPVSINSIRGRYFLSENTAVRGGVFLNYRLEDPSATLTRNAMEIRLEPGIEKHLSGTNRLSPYFGGALNIGFKAAASETGTDQNGTRITGAWNQSGTERGYFSLGLMAVAGADFFVARHVYLGTEISFGINWQKNSDIKSETGNTVTTESEGGSNFELGPRFNNAIRLGFVF